MEESAAGSTKTIELNEFQKRRISKINLSDEIANKRPKAIIDSFEDSKCEEGEIQESENERKQRTDSEVSSKALKLVVDSPKRFKNNAAASSRPTPSELLILFLLILSRRELCPSDTV